ncbi:phosphoinositide phosphatase family protein [Striga asiatica]|uniref:Phosphoinositide phosphatase family protein n=1 Tax=Striga asiatica TaxID=4170 RepID=A0A5A7RDT7_STRAF|nr:phosphoinositide phosphatase family protein [Striga asiatica]
MYAHLRTSNAPPQSPTESPVKLPLPRPSAYPTFVGPIDVATVLICRRRLIGPSRPVATVTISAAETLQSSATMTFTATSPDITPARRGHQPIECHLGLHGECHHVSGGEYALKLFLLGEIEISDDGGV